MVPAALLSPAGTVQSLCSATSSIQKWQPKRLVSSGSVLSRSSSHSNRDRTSLKSSLPLSPLDSVFGRRRAVLHTRGGLSRRLFTAAVEGSIAIEEPSEAASVEEAQEGAAPAPPPPVKERFKPRIPGQKARREDPSVPSEALVVGAVFTGTVTTIQPFGAFVNFGAFTDGLVHISKLSTGYVSNISDFVTLGQEVKVTILNVEPTSGRIALSMVEKEEREAREAAAAARAGDAREGGERSRFQQGSDGRPVNRGRIAGGGRQTRRDEPQKPPTKLVKGQEVEGTVKNKNRSGVFVELPENEEGFLRYGDIPGGENMAPESSLQTGEKIKATVLKIERGKVVLTMKPIVDIVSINRNINKGGDTSATNPFEIAFRAFNFIPEVAVSAKEDLAKEGGGLTEATTSVEVAPTAVEEDAAPEVTAAVEEAPVAIEEVVSEATAAAVVEVPAVIEEAVREAPASVEDVVSEATAIAVEEESAAEAAVVEEAAPETIPGVAAAVEEAPVVDEEVAPETSAEVAAVFEEGSSVEVIPGVEDVPAAEESGPETTAGVEESPALEEVIPGLISEVAVIVEEAPALEEEVVPETDTAVEDAHTTAESAPEPVAEPPVAEEVIPEATSEAVPVPIKETISEAVPEPIKEAISDIPEAISEAVPEPIKEAISDIPEVISEAVPEPISEAVPEPISEAVPEPISEAVPEPISEAVPEPIPETVPEVISKAIPEAMSEVAVAIDEALAAGEEVIAKTVAAIEEAPVAEEVVPEASALVEQAAVAAKELVSDPVKEAPVAAKPEGVSAALVKQLRDDTGAGMMDCKRALTDSGGDIEEARETLRKKGLASADKKASRIASEGLIGSYIHDSRIGVLVEVNCETDFVSRGPAFKSLVEDVGMQVVASQQVQFVSVDDIPAEFVNKEKEVETQREDLASKPDAIRARIVEGRVAKTLNEITLLEQPYIRDDKILVKDLVKQTVASLGENIKVRRFERYILGEGLQKKGTDFAAEVAAQTAVKTPVTETPKAEEIPAPDAMNTVVVSAVLVKELRDQTGAGMMDCKKALKATENDLEKAVDFLRKKGLSSADKKASRLASEGLIGTYIHDGRIGILIEVNCETDFVARGEQFKELVEDLAMQAAAYPLVKVVSVDDVPAEVVAKEKEMEAGKEDLVNKPEAIRARIVDGRVAKRLAELALLEQPFIKDDKKLVKDVVKERVASLGENILVRRFTRFNLGEGIAKKVVDFASEVAAQTGVKA